MNFRKFEILILLQIILIALTSFISAWAFLQDHLRVSGFYFLIILLLEIIGLYFFIIRQNRNLIQFLEGLVHRDEFTRLEESGSRQHIHKLLNQIAESYSIVKIEKESEHQYLLNTVKHVSIGLISFNESGQIELFNTALEGILGVRAAAKLETLCNVSEELPGLLREIKSGKPILYKLNRNGEILHLSIHATVFKIQDHEVKLISIQDIASEIQQEEIEIWQKLIRVLTHEIMNSAGPITSLSSTLLSLMNDIEPEQSEVCNKLKTGLTAIEKRSKGLAKFVETYRSLTRVPEPVISTIKVKELIEQIVLLSRTELEKNKIEIKTTIRPATLELAADEKLITQVLINVVKNAMEAFIEGKSCTCRQAGKKAKSKSVEPILIKINARKNSSGKTVITVFDNGSVIPPDILDKVFVPFYTTKESGSGIGLSLSRQIMHKHGGSIRILSGEEGTEVILEL